MAVSKGLKIFKVNTKLPGHLKEHYQNSKCKLVESVILPDSVHRDEVCRGEQPRLGLLFLCSVPFHSAPWRLGFYARAGKNGQRRAQTLGPRPWHQEPHTVSLAQKNKLYPHIHEVSSAHTVGKAWEFPISHLALFCCPCSLFLLSFVN